MWKLNKPSKIDAKNDLDVLIAHCDNLDATDKPMLEQLYEDYDNGNGEVTTAQLAATNSKKDIIKGQYDKTSGKDKNTGQDKVLVYMRNELMDPNLVDKCPYCSINKPSQLDHFMDKSKYGQLATCRLNLVPLCGPCNRLKHDKPYTGFMHPYYPRVKRGIIFLKADCTIVRGRVSVAFSIDASALNDAALTARLTNQITEINLQSRLRKAVNEFLTHELLRSHVKTNAGLRRTLTGIEKNLGLQYGDNDWRTAVIRGLKGCAAFDITVVENYRNHPVVINGGAVL